MPRWFLGSELPERLQDEAKRRFTSRYTRDFRPVWLDRPQANGVPPLPFDSDTEWLARTEFPVVGDGDQMRFPNRTLQLRSQATYPDNPEVRPEAPQGLGFERIDPNMALTLAQRVAAMAGASVFVRVDAGHIGDMSFWVPQGVADVWRKVTPAGEVKRLPGPSE